MAKTTKSLTNTEVERAKIKDKDYTLFDGGGLFLLVKAIGGKFWRFRYQQPFTKKRVLLGVGKYPDISLQQARKQRDEYLSLLAQDIDPQEHRQQQEAEELSRISSTLRTVAEQWREKKSAEVLPKTMEKNWARLENHLFPQLADIPISEVTPKVVISVLKPLQQRGVGDTLHRVIRLLNEVMNFAVNAELIEFNKCATINKNFTATKTENNPTIRPEELPQFLEALRDYNLSLQAKILIKWQLLTMSRPKEASNALWSEIDFEAKTWTITAERMKMKRAHVVPLSRQCLALLEKMKGITGHSPFIFQSEVKANQPMNSQTANRAIKLLGYQNRLTAHGLRSIASTYLNEQLVNYDVVEACLAHVIQDQTRKAYNRSDYFDQRIEVMQQWADYVESCSKGI